MVEYSKYNDFLLVRNLNGDADGIVKTGTIPGQPLSLLKGWHQVGYSFLKSSSDILATQYYGAAVEEVRV